jgi:hypothetical protein
MSRSDAGKGAQKKTRIGQNADARWEQSKKEKFVAKLTLFPSATPSATDNNTLLRTSKMRNQWRGAKWKRTLEKLKHWPKVAYATYCEA